MKLRNSRFLEKLSMLLESARISIHTVEDYIEFYRTGKLNESFDSSTDQILEFKLETLSEKPQVSQLDIIRDKTDDVNLILDKLIDEISSFKKIQ